MLKLFFTIFLCLPFLLFSQIKGIILDEKNQDPIAGAKINLSSGQKVQTDANGEFILSPSFYPVDLYISMLGYVNDSLIITKDTSFTKYLLFESIKKLRKSRSQWKLSSQN